MGKDWWRGAVIYQVYPRSFKDSNGDGIGDLPGITAGLDHVASLGVDAIWVSPFFRSPMKDFGYDVADYRSVDPLFGTLEDFDALLARAHSLGLKVIIDQVLSHTSDQHAWFGQSRASRDADNAKADWYVWADAKPDGSAPNNWLSVFGGPAWQWDSRRKQYYFHSFLAEQPDLNFHCQAVQEALLAEVRFWCERGVDGFRFDACNHQFHDALLRDNPPADPAGIVSTVKADNPYAMQRHLYDKSRPENLVFLERLRALLDEHGAVGLGEVGDEDAPPLMAAYTERGKRLHLAYSFSLLTDEHSPMHLRAQVQALEDAMDHADGWGCWAVSNHDSVRVASRWNANGALDTRRDRLWLSLLLMLRGSACIYQGEELGLPEAEVPFERLQDPYGRAFWPEFKGRDGARTPLPWSAAALHGGFSTGSVEPWLPVSPLHLPLAIDQQEGDPHSMLSFSRTLLRWRRHNPVLRDGAMRFIDLPEPLLGLERFDGTHRLQALFNLSDQKVTVELADMPVPARASPFFGARIDEDRLHLPPYGVFVGAPIGAA